MFPFGLPDLLRWQRNRHTGTLRTMADDEGTREGTTSLAPAVRGLPAAAPAPADAGCHGADRARLRAGRHALVWGGERGCDAARGRPTCGGYGLLMLIAIIVICYLVGLVLLKAFDVRDPGVTAFFGITLPLLVVLVFLLDDVFDTWMAYAVPLLVAVGFVVSAYLARALEAANPRPYADER